MLIRARYIPATEDEGTQTECHADDGGRNYARVRYGWADRLSPRDNVAAHVEVYAVDVCHYDRPRIGQEMRYSDARYFAVRELGVQDAWKHTEGSALISARAAVLDVITRHPDWTDDDTIARAADRLLSPALWIGCAERAGMIRDARAVYATLATATPEEATT